MIIDTYQHSSYAVRLSFPSISLSLFLSLSPPAPPPHPFVLVTADILTLIFNNTERLRVTCIDPAVHINVICADPSPRPPSLSACVHTSFLCSEYTQRRNFQTMGAVGALRNQTKNKIEQKYYSLENIQAS